MELLHDPDVQSGIMILIIALLFMAGVQLNRIEKQNEGLFNLLQEIRERR
jgi:hypothetical protein